MLTISRSDSVKNRVRICVNIGGCMMEGGGPAGHLDTPIHLLMRAEELFFNAVR